MTYAELEKKALFQLDEKETGNAAVAIRRKLPLVADTAQKSVAQYAKIYKSIALQASKDGERAPLPKDVLQFEYLESEDGAQVRGYRLLPDNTIELARAGAYTGWYSKVPDTVPTGEPDYVFELCEPACEVMLMGVCASLQKMEYDLRYFNDFFSEYQGMLANLSPRFFGAAVVTADETVEG